MEHSSFAIALLADLDEAEREIALAAADEYLWLELGELAVLAGVQKVHALRMENRLQQLGVDLEKVAENQKKAAEFDEQINNMRDMHDVISEKMIAYGAKLIEQKSKHKKLQSEAGIQGARIKNKSTNALKVWAIESAKQLRGDDKANAKALFKVIPDELREASVNPERLIYETLLAARKEDKLKRQAGHT